MVGTLQFVRTGICEDEGGMSMREKIILSGKEVDIVLASLKKEVRKELKRRMGQQILEGRYDKRNIV